jgi:hypothetical protein
MARSKPFAVGVLLAAGLLLAGSIAFAASRGDDRGWSMMRYGPGMMGYGASGGGNRVDGVGEARRQAQRFADRLDLRVGEVMRFRNNYYAELLEDDGDRATEVLVNPGTGAVWLEYGPAMMWNTRYGMMTGARVTGRTMGSMMGGADMMGRGDPTWAPRDARTRVDPAEARRLARRWLAANRTGVTAGEAEAFPGYYTLHTLRRGRVIGMLSVNAATGAIWEHWWHGAFVTMSG